VSYAKSLPESSRVYIRLANTKRGRNRCVDVLDAGMAELLRAVVQGAKPGARLFPFSAATCNASLKAMCVKLGVPAVYTMHSMRHGGATKLYVEQWPVMDIMFRGRWKASDSADNYIQMAVGQALQCKIPRDVALFGFACAQNLVRAFALAQKK
jgi:hypothetical protein